MHIARYLAVVSALLCAPLATAQDRRAAILERARALESFAGERVGRATGEVLKQATAIAEGTVFFYGRTPVKVGLKDIDWSGGHIKHQEWPAQLNRFFQLRPLAGAYRATGDERFARAARAYIEDWLRGERYDTATAMRPGDNTLTMSIRLGSGTQAGWGGTLPVFLASPAFDDEFLGRVLDSMARQAQYLSRHLTAVGNWRIAQLDALIFTALRLPFLPGARELLDIGVQGQRNALATQFLPDGVHMERTPGYADWMTRVAANAVKLARVFPEADLGVDTGRLVRALDYNAQSELFGVNDSLAAHRDPSSFSALAARAEWIAELGLKGHPERPPLDQVFASAGQVFSRTAWEPGADYVAFDAGTWGGGHNHLSRLSFVFRSGGRMMVADPGILTYEMSDPRGPYGKSTLSHTTLNLGGRNQSGADAQLLKTAFTKDAALIQARYQGAYWDGRFDWGYSAGRGAGAWGDHERILFWRKGEYLLVLDTMAADDGQEIRNVWQLGPQTRWVRDAAGFGGCSENPDTNVALDLVVAPRGTSMQVSEGRREPLGGWVGWHGDDAVPAPQVEFRYPSRRGTGVLSAVLVAAYKGGARPRFAVKTTPGARGIHHLEITVPGGATDLVAWSDGLGLAVDDDAPFVTDATFVWRRGGGVGAYFAPGATYLRQGGKPVFTP